MLDMEYMWSNHWPGEAGVPCTHETCNRGNEKNKIKINKNQNDIVLNVRIPAAGHGV